MFRNLYIKLGLLGVALFCLGWSLGRGTRPEPEIKYVKEAEGAADKSWKSMVAEVEITTLSKDTSTKEKIVTRWLRPDGSLEKEEQIDREEDTKESSDSKKDLVASQEIKEVIKWKTKEILVTKTAVTDWSVYLSPTFPMSELKDLKVNPELALGVTRKVATVHLPFLGDVHLEAGGTVSTDRKLSLLFVGRF